MENKKIKIWHIIVIVLSIILILPILINFGIQTPAFFPFVGTPENWLMFWPTYLSAAVSLLMVIATFLTLRQNQEQLSEMKKPHVSITFSQVGNVASLRLVNTSNVEIRNLTINGDFYVGEQKNDFFNLSALKNFNIDIEPHGIRNIILCDNFNLDTDEGHFELQLSYNGLSKDVTVHCSNFFIVGDTYIESMGKRK